MYDEKNIIFMKLNGRNKFKIIVENCMKISNNDQSVMSRLSQRITSRLTIMHQRPYEQSFKLVKMLKMKTITLTILINENDSDENCNVNHFDQ